MRRSISSFVNAFMIVIVITLVSAASVLHTAAAQDTKAEKVEDTSGGPDTGVRKARIAVMPATYVVGARSQFRRELSEKLGLSDPTMIENPGFTGHLVDALVNSRKFDVLEREALRLMVNEIDFAESDYGNLSKTVQLGKMLTADYVVLPEIQFIDIVVEEKDVPYVPARRVEYMAKMATRTRVVRVETGRVVSSSFDETVYSETPKRDDDFASSFGLSFINNLYAEVASKETAKIIDIAYPIRVLAIHGAEVTINRGKGAIAAGETLAVYRQGESMVDPDTREDLGFLEQVVGKVEVSEVEAKMSSARIVEGAGDIVIGDVCRRVGKSVGIEKSAPPKID